MAVTPPSEMTKHTFDELVPFITELLRQPRGGGPAQDVRRQPFRKRCAGIRQNLIDQACLEELAGALDRDAPVATRENIGAASRSRKAPRWRYEWMTTST